MYNPIKKIRKLSKAKILLLIFAFVIFFYYFLSPLPSLKNLKNQAYSLRINDNEGNILYISSISENSGIRREYSPLKAIPPHVQKALIKAEDRRFFFHSGIDFPALFRAVFQDTKQKRAVSGASTITMQLARLSASPEGAETPGRTLFDKILEADRALKFEARLSKKRILELYLNTLPFGNNVQGVTSAARFYFSKELKDISEEEACLLAIIPRRPKDYNPIDNPEKAAKKASEVFSLPFEELYKTASSARKYYWPFKAEHLVQRVLQEQRQAQEQKSGRFGKKPSQKSRNATAAPPDTLHTINLTVNSTLQDFSSYTLREKLYCASKSRINNGAVIVLDNKNGTVLCYIGNADWNDTKTSGAIDGITAKNQMGSSMKPFLYAAAMENSAKGETNASFSPYMLLDDIPMEFGSTNIYLPRNFNNRHSGPVLFRQALASSLNIPAVYLLSKIGVPHYLQVLFDLGFDSLKDVGENYDLGLSLGAGEVTLFELARAFSVFPNDGILKEFSYYESPLSYSAVNKASSKSHKASPPATAASVESNDGKQVFEKDTARILCSMLSDKSSRSRGFGYTQTFQTDYPSIFKTGTANQYQSIVALGATPEYTVAVWMGNFSGNTVVGKTGSSLPALCAKEILDFLTEGSSEASKGSEAAPGFLEPENYQKIKICPLSGMYPGPDCPVSVTEYAETKNIPGIKEHTCTWHKKDENGNLITVYPSRYQTWLSDKRKGTEINYSDYPLEITTPKNNSIFYLVEENREYQKIPFQVEGGFSEDEELLVFYDGKPFTENPGELNKRILRPFSFVVPVERGYHTVKVQLGNEQTSVTYEVR